MDFPASPFAREGESRQRYVENVEDGADDLSGGHKTDTSGGTHAVTAGTEPLDESGRLAGQTCVGDVRW